MESKNVVPLHEGIQLEADASHGGDVSPTDNSSDVIRRYLALHEGVEVTGTETGTDDMKILKEVLSRMAARQPQMLELPRAPTAGEIREARRTAGLSKEQAAKLCGVFRTTWVRWETGSHGMPEAVWAWFRVASGGAGLAGGGEAWARWCFWKGALCSPEGMEFTPGQVRSLPILWQRLRALEAQNRKLASELEFAHGLNTRMSQTYGAVKALGQLEALTSAICSVFRRLGEGEDGMPPVLPEIDSIMKSVLVPVIDVQMRLLRLQGETR